MILVKGKLRAHSHLCEDADGARDAEQHGVEVSLRDAVVLQQHAAVCVYVRPRVLHLHDASSVKTEL